MANPTTNYGFVLPTPTDLVTDLPADFDVALQGVDTQMLTNANAAIAKTIVDAKGDIIAATAADAVSRLAVGANNTVLTADSTTATGLKWAAAGGGKTWSLLSTTAMTGASTVTVSGIADKEDIFILVIGAKSATASISVDFRINADSGAKYSYTNTVMSADAAYNSYQFSAGSAYQTTALRVAYTASNANSTIGVALQISGAKSTGMKNIFYNGGASFGGGSGQTMYSGNGIYEGAAQLTNISFIGSSAFNAGTIYLYGA